MLEEEPGLSLPMLRELYKHNASAREYRAHMESLKSGKAVQAHPLQAEKTRTVLYEGNL